jgi:hypothetical protein
MDKVNQDSKKKKKAYTYCVNAKIFDPDHIESWKGKQRKGHGQILPNEL